MQEHLLYEDLNTEWGYNKVALIDKGDDAFDLIYVANQGIGKNIIKRYAYPAYYLQGLRKISNLRHQVEKPSLIKRLLNF